MRSLCLLIIAFFTPSVAIAQAGIWKKCSVANSTLCGPTSCTSDRKADISLYLGSYDKNGKPNGYYYRCKAALEGACDIIEDYSFASEPQGYSAWSSKSHSSVTRMSGVGKMTDILSENEYVLISRGVCVDSAPPIITIRTAH